MRVYVREERDDCKFRIINKNEFKKAIKTIEDAWDKLRILNLTTSNLKQTKTFY